MSYHRALGFVAVALVAACGGADLDDVAEVEAPLISDIASMVQEADGTFTVTCKDGGIQRGVTRAQLLQEHVCNGTTPAPLPVGLVCLDVPRSECSASAGEIWNGGRCCVPNQPVCVSALASECTAQTSGEITIEHWFASKSLCCVENKPACFRAAATDCNGGGEHWFASSSTCCFEHSPVCLTTPSTECTAAGEHWFASVSTCCAQNVSSCVQTSASQCTQGHWFASSSTCCF